MRTRAAWLGYIASCFACGGTTPPPEPAPAPVEERAQATPPPEEAGATEAASDAPVKSSVSAEEDVAAILQLVVDDPELDSHLHLDQPGRFPLKIAGDKLPSGLKLVKAREPVMLVEPPKSKKEAVLVITEMDLRGERATVRYRYDVEGLRGTVTLARSAHGWELKNSRLVEH